MIDCLQLLCPPPAGVYSASLGPHTKDKILQLEKVQRMTVRWTTNNFDYLSSVIAMIDNLMIDIPRSPSYGVYISQRIRFARVCSNVEYFNNRNLFLAAKLLKQSCRYHKICKAFSKLYHSELFVKYNIGFKTLLQQGISEPTLYRDLFYKFKSIVGKPNFSDQFKKISNVLKRLDITWISCDSLHSWL